jgi:uncharacterized protein Yka (UPF0111/DUF47 family)
MSDGKKANGDGGVFGRLFPPKYDFHQMLVDQAVEMTAGTKALHDWLKAGILSEPNEIVKKEKSVDDMRHSMEERLMVAFSTPFDRREIYSISHQMGQILDFAVSTYLEMRAFGVHTDDAMLGMASSLHRGTDLFVDAMRSVTSDPPCAEKLIRDIRKSEHDIENFYIEAMAEAFRKADAPEAMKKREIYHHLKDAGRALSSTVDILHRVVVTFA